LKYTGKLERLQKDENWLRILVFRKKKAMSRINRQEKVLIQEKKKKDYLLASLEHSKKMYASQVYKLKKRRRSLEALLVKIVKEKLKKRYTYKEAARKPFYLLKRKLIFPVRRGIIIDEFGKKYDKVIGIYTKNNGIDVRVDKKESVYAVYSGCVDYVGDVPGYGETIILNHLNKYYTIYAGMDTVDVREHDSVAVGRQLGKVTGCLHFELRKQTLALNPLNWLNCKNIRRKR
jgi:murein DD-endopeptidase MepM/ murein hydrolase activator NlpD